MKAKQAYNLSINSKDAEEAFSTVVDKIKKAANSGEVEILFADLKDIIRVRLKQLGYQVELIYMEGLFEKDIVYCTKISWDQAN